jgi:hypothetical protein
VCPPLLSFPLFFFCSSPVVTVVDRVVWCALQNSNTSLQCSSFVPCDTHPRRTAADAHRKTRAHAQVSAVCRSLTHSLAITQSYRVRGRANGSVGMSARAGGAVREACPSQQTPAATASAALHGGQPIGQICSAAPLPSQRTDHRPAVSPIGQSLSAGLNPVKSSGTVAVVRTFRVVAPQPTQRPE